MAIIIGKCAKINEMAGVNVPQQVSSEAKETLATYSNSNRLVNSLTITPVFGGICDLEYLVGSAHKQPWRPPAKNMGPLCLIESCDLRSQETLAASGREIHMPGMTGGLQMVT